MGLYALESILLRDFVVVQGVGLVFAFAYVLVNLTVDLTYVWLHPRIRYA